MFDLTPADFSADGQKLASRFASKTTIVKFYLPNCIWCKRSQPDYEKLDKIAGGDFNIAQADCSKYRQIPEMVKGSKVYGYTIQGYPTYVIFVKGEYRMMYEGDRSTKDMINALVHAS